MSNAGANYFQNGSPVSRLFSNITKKSIAFNEGIVFVLNILIQKILNDANFVVAKFFKAFAKPWVIFRKLYTFGCCFHFLSLIANLKNSKEARQTIERIK